MNAPYELRSDAVAVVRLDNPPVNSLGQVLRQALFHALRAAQADPRAAAIVLEGRGDGFSAGGDLVEFRAGTTFAQPDLPGVIFDLIEHSPKPVVAALHGYALGGGLELALACHGRVAAWNCRVGLPETTLGLLPGAGGTQRLPRAVGLEAATSMIVNGNQVEAGTLADSLLFDAISDQPLEEACRLALVLAEQGQPFPLLRRLRVQHPEPQGFLAFARQQARGRRHYNSALPKAIDAIGLSLAADFDAATRQEQQLFRGQLDDPESLAIRHAFLAERLAPKVAGLEPDAALPVREVVVIGAGFMGSSIATCLLRAGCRVSLYDSQPGAAQAAAARLAEQEDSPAGQLRVIEGFAEMAPADLVIEAVVERLDVKQAIFAELGRHCRADAVLASNTSSLDLDRIAEASGCPERVVGLHFFGPAQVMRLLEVVRGEKTAAPVLATALVLAKRLRKVAVVAGVCRGFIGNRLFDRYLLQALALASEGIAPQRIDQALERWGMKMGPFKVMDLVGIDLLRGAWTGVHEQAGIGLLARLCDAGRTGQRAGLGWYRYDQGPKAQIDPGLDGLVGATGEERVIEDSGIVQRCVLALVNEGARVLEEGIAQRASDIDVVFLLGYGFPGSRGGPMFWASTQGLAATRRQLCALAEQTGDAFWQPAALIDRLATELKDFSSVDSHE
ncbi:3-hydroxyacyl-CoA dehydrogenase [Pseudomonas delhiensis]|uniref:3-hydroxyacyl-CoA dehydrogenase n=1 Tax=Pseudomonas delhiensis TaxID=366289 RepID=A0A239N9Z8_9PSED|nr:FAD-dependent oxidoreductase [Pseudomonas delhiensis]SDK19625.1 3-hydroxyacyl-CoA dehydrogenase [Pseudomonas delhiensis]SNT51731.1 3-hydroxyacyl-CoA dehydrogenase [Pseudomonas delhiensis]